MRLRDRERERESEIDKVERGRTGGYRVNWPASTTVSPSLAMSYARAKQTFFAPNSDYALCVPPDLLTPFFRVGDDSDSAKHHLGSAHSGSFPCSEDEHVNKYFGSPHPDPEVFTEIALYVQKRLENSLRNCVRAAYSNVGTFRATCGICAGIFITLATAFPPLLVNFLKSQDRWLRLAAIPGLWLGLTILCASLKGVCMMVYVFGDFRQLRKFELARPPPAGDEEKVAEHYLGSDSRSGAPLVRPPVSPPVALTAPPRMPIHLPSRIPPTPSLTYSHGRSFSYYSRPTSSSGASMSMTEADTTLHTISISSSRKPGGTDAHGRDDSSSISVPACDSSDDESSEGHSSFYARRAEQRTTHRSLRVDTNLHPQSDDESDEEDDDDCGIYISPAIAPPDELAELELIGSSAVEKVIAAAARAGLAEAQAREGDGTNVTGSGTSGSTMEKAEKTDQEKVSHPPPPTAAFIPMFHYRYSEHDELGLGGGPREGGREVKRKVGDLEKGTAMKMPERLTNVLTVTKTAAAISFDFDALPPVKRERVDSIEGDNEKNILSRISFLRPNTGNQLPTHIEAQVHVQVDCDADIGLTPKPSGVDEFDARRRETVTSTTLTMLSQSNNGIPNSHQVREALSPTSTFLNTNVTSFSGNEKGLSVPVSPTTASPISGHSNVTYVASLGRNKSGTRIDEKSAIKKKLSSFLLHIPPFSRHADPNKPSGCNNYRSYGQDRSVHYFKTSRRSRGVAMDDMSDSDSWRRRFAKTQHVPAFGPVTRVLNPVVTRAQWEIVVRSAVLALVMSLSIVLGLCAVPVR